MPKPCNCGGRKSIDASQPDIYQSVAAYSDSDELVRVAARSYIVLRTTYGNYKLKSGNSMMMPRPIVDDLLGSEIGAPIWIVP